MSPSVPEIKLILRIICLFLLIQVIHSPAILAESGLVASLQGDAWLLKGTGEDKFRLKTGQPVPAGARIKTGPRSVLRILNPDGSMQVVHENRSQVYTLKRVQNQDPVNLSRFLKNFSQSGYQTYGTTVRNLAGESLSNRFLQKNAEDSIPLLLRQMAGYDRDRQWNRLNAGLAMLKNSYPESTPFRQLDFVTPERVDIIPIWRFWRITASGKRVGLAESTPLDAGAPFQITYTGTGSGYFYVLVTDWSGGEYHSTRLIYPPTLPEAAHQQYPLPEVVSEYLSLTLPGVGSAYFQNRDCEAELFWAFSCLAPLSNTALHSLIHQSFNPGGSGSSNKTDISTQIEKIRPSVCPQSMIRVIPVVRN